MSRHRSGSSCAEANEERSLLIPHRSLSDDDSTSIDRISSADSLGHSLISSNNRAAYGSVSGYNHRRLNDEYVILPDHGTILGLQIPSIQETPELDNPVTVALQRCRDTVLKPYLCLLTTLGWRPLYESLRDRFIFRVLNVLHILAVVILIFLGYVIQYGACFHRDRAVPSSRLRPSKQANHSDSGSNGGARHKLGHCPHYELVWFVVCDILHSAAYCYAFYILRIMKDEYLITLVQKVFLRSSQTHSGYQSQARLVRTLRNFLLFGVMWAVVSCTSQVIHIVAQYDIIRIHLFEVNVTESRGVLLVLMVLGFLALDVVYVAVVTSYSIQCQLLVVYFRGLKEKVRENSSPLQDVIKDIGEASKYLKQLNSQMAPAVALLMSNYVVSTIMGIDALTSVSFSTDTEFILESISNVMYVVLWLVIAALPLMQAARVSAAGNSLRKLGHEVRERPFGYVRTEQSDLDSFLLYCSTLQLRAKILWIPISATCLCSFVAALVIGLLLILQLGTAHMWF